MTETPVMPQIWFLFGLSGSGKTYAGNIIAAETGWDVYHADEDITPAMRTALQQSQAFTPAMREEYFALLVDKIHRRKRPGQPLLVTQGAYKQRNRDFLRLQIPGLELVWIDAPDDLVLRRLQLRRDGISPASAAALTGDFEVPANGLRIINDGDGLRILEQFNACLADSRRTHQPRG
jgi:gluconokinase